MNTRRIIIDPNCIEKSAMDLAGQILREGSLVAFPTETVYGLGGNALDADASRKIYEAKGRPSDNPLIVHIADLQELAPLVREVTEDGRRLAEAFWPGPLTMVFPKSEAVPYATTGGLDTVAVRMPSDPIARAMIRAAGVPVAAPSANTSGRPSPTNADHVAEDLNGRIELILDGGDVGIGLESTIVDVTGPVPMVLRPGYISMEMIREVTGAVDIDPAILKKPEADLKPKAPGMKYRHYAPKADLTILKGSPEAVTAEILKRAEGHRAAGKTVGVICTQETRPAFSELVVKCIGSRHDEEAIAHNLYRILREFDEEAVDVIYSESFDGTGLCQAIMNRLTKAAGYHIEEV